MKFVLTSIISIWLTIVVSTQVNAQASAGYTLNPGDQLHISVWREETLDKQVIVLPDGNITFPLIGSVSVVGVTGSELEEILEDRLEAQIPDAEVTVLINSVDGNRVFVIGKVLRPGEFIMSSQMTVAQVLSLAGGLDRFADGNSIKIQRNEAGNITFFEYNYDDLLAGRNIAEMGFILKAGDVVIVP